LGLAGFLTFGMGLIQAFFYCGGTIDAASDKLKSLVIGLLKIGAPRRKIKLERGQGRLMYDANDLVGKIRQV